MGSPRPAVLPQLFTLARLQQRLQIDSTNAETDFYQFTVPAGLLLQNRIRSQLRGEFGNNTGAPRTFRLRVYLNGTAIFDDTSAAQASAGANRPLSIDLDFFASSAGIQMTGQVQVGISPATAAPGRGSLSSAAVQAWTIGALTTAVDPSIGDVTVRLTMELSAIAGSLLVSREVATVERL